MGFFGFGKSKEEEERERLEALRKKHAGTLEKLKKGELKVEKLKHRLEKFYEKVLPSINHQVKRWHIPESTDVWEMRIQKMRNYFDDRATNYDRHLQKIIQN